VISNSLHLAVAHKQREIVELLLKANYDPNLVAICNCKGNCNGTGNASLSSIIPRTHANTPETCSICSQLRVSSLIGQTPILVAVRCQAPIEILVQLIGFGADVNSTDAEGNTPLLLAVRESPLNWNCLHTLIFFGARILQKNNRGICPLDLAPELLKIQESCVESLFQTACTTNEETLHPPVTRATTSRQSKKLNVESGKYLNS
jgi:ankyrin repeat protein